MEKASGNSPTQTSNTHPLNAGNTYPSTADELSLAYRKGGLRRVGVSYQTAILDPLLRRVLEAHVRASRKQQQRSEFTTLLQPA